MSLKHIEIYFLRYMPVYCRLTPVWDISSLSSTPPPSVALASFRDYSKATRVRHARGLWILIRIHGFEHFTCLYFRRLITFSSLQTEKEITVKRT